MKKLKDSLFPRRTDFFPEQLTPGHRGEHFWQSPPTQCSSQDSGDEGPQVGA